MYRRHPGGSHAIHETYDSAYDTASDIASKMLALPQLHLTLRTRREFALLIFAVSPEAKSTCVDYSTLQTDA